MHSQRLRGGEGCGVASARGCAKGGGGKFRITKKKMAALIHDSAASPAPSNAVYLLYLCSTMLPLPVFCVSSAHIAARLPHTNPVIRRARPAARPGYT